MGNCCILELICGNPEEALCCLCSTGVEVRDVARRDMLTLRICVSESALPRVHRLAERKGWKLRELGHKGILPIVRRLWSRPVLTAGVLLLFLLAAGIPSRVLFFRVSGNTTVPARYILEEAARCGVYFGASRREIRSERVKNALLTSIPELSWVGVNTRGCVAEISVRERAPEVTRQEGGITGIYALRPGIVTSITVERGSPCVRVGEGVQTGQLLISGYTDCQRYISLESARGEVFGETIRVLRGALPDTRYLRGEKLGTRYGISLAIGKKWIQILKSSGFSYAGCDKIRSEYPLTLPGGFSLPVTLIVERMTGYALGEVPSGGAWGNALLRDEVRAYLRRDMLAGEIQGAEEIFSADAGRPTMAGVYRCRELLGRARLQEIEELHGKAD